MVCCDSLFQLRCLQELMRYQLDAAALMVKQNLQAQQQAMIKQDISFLHDVQQNVKQLYTGLSQTADPAIQHSVKLLEANSALRIMSAITQTVNQKRYLGNQHRHIPTAR